MHILALAWMSGRMPTSCDWTAGLAGPTVFPSVIRSVWATAGSNMTVFTIPWSIEPRRLLQPVRDFRMAASFAELVRAGVASGNNDVVESTGRTETTLPGKTRFSTRGDT